MEAANELAPLIVLPVFFFFIILGLKFHYDWKKTRLKSDLHHKLVDKFGNVKDLNEFLQSRTGSDFLQSLSISGLRPKEKLMSAVSTGVIVGFLGIAVLVLSWVFEESMRYLIGAGVAIFVLGIGFLVSAAVSFHLSKKWGIIEKE